MGQQGECPWKHHRLREATQDVMPPGMICHILSSSIKRAVETLQKRQTDHAD